MEVISKVSDLQKIIQEAKKSGRNAGFVPTMGALHKGHISLIASAKEKCDIVVSSIFINPTQFNDNEDFIKYPVSTEQDTELLAAAGCDILFLPDKEEVYPGGAQNMPVYDFGRLETIFEGAYRPGHFRGVGQVVARLLDIVQPDVLFLGQKDYQQCLIIKELINMSGMHAHPEIIICPTIREEDGLAMSSRNRRLTDSQRAVAGTLYQCLVSVKAKQGFEKFQRIKKECMDLMEHKGFRPEYLAIADTQTLEPLDDFEPGREMIVMVAARLGDVRLIDNMFL